MFYFKHVICPIKIDQTEFEYVELNKFIQVQKEILLLK